MVEPSCEEIQSDALAPEPGWAPMGPWPFPHGRPGQFVVGDDSGNRFRIRYYRDAVDPHVFHGKVWFGPGTEGPPMHAHGGAMAAVLDEALGTACWVAGIAVVAGTLTTRYRKMLPLCRVVLVEARIEGRGGRSVRVVGRLYDANGTYTEAEAVYVAIEGQLAEDLKSAMVERG